MNKIRSFLYRRPLAFVVGVLAFFNPFLFYLSTDFHASFATVLPGIHIIVRVLAVVLAAGVLGLLFLRNLGLWPRFTAV